jgi:hypothetical protein
MSPTPHAIEAELAWPRFPSLYEINTWVWLGELSRKQKTRVDLSSVPASEWDAIAAYGFDAVWLMGVWERSPESIAIANRNPELLASFRLALPDYRPEDNVGSPYSVRSYVVDEHLGGPSGLAVARQELAKRGVRLVLDFVPNHVAPDHPWATDHPEYFIHGTSEDVKSHPAAYLEAPCGYCACGRDPYFPPWPDVLQLNAFDLQLRRAVIATVSKIAEQCDGIRCDMAMLMLNSVFEGTWGAQAGQPPKSEYWTDVISAVKAGHKNFLFIAEAYWNLEWQLQQLGFDFCYDKTLYDRLQHDNAESVRLHLCADAAYQNKLLRFIENHDEQRAAVVFPGAKLRAAAVTTATLSGARLFHEGQLEGRRIKLPVFLARRPDEPVDEDLLAFYKRLLKITDDPVFREGQWTLCERSGWPDNQSFQNVVAWAWRKDDQRYVVAVNLSEWQSQAQVRMPWADVGGTLWNLIELLSETTYPRGGDELLSPGLYLDLGPWGCQIFHFL